MEFNIISYISHEMQALWYYVILFFTFWRSNVNLIVWRLHCINCMLSLCVYCSKWLNHVKCMHCTLCGNQLFSIIVIIKLISSRHAKSHNHEIIDCMNIFRLRKDWVWSTVKFVENIIFNSINDTLLHEDYGNTSPNL